MSYREEDKYKMASVILTLVFASYFFLYEIFQMYIQMKSYFSSIWNIMDLIRMALIYTVILMDMLSYDLPKWINPVMLLLMWIKIFNYLAVFESTRYLIKMIFEIIEDVSAFLIILVTAILAYT